MTKYTRRSVLAALGIGLGNTAVGCLTRSVESNRSSRTASETPPEATETTSTPEETPTAYWIERASNTPDSDKPIYVRGDGTADGTVRVRVVREATGETVHDQRHAVSGGSTEVYNLEDADPDGVEQFTVCAELVSREATGTTTAETTVAVNETTATETATASDSHSDCSTIATNECYGTVDIVVEDGQVRTIFAIC